MTLSSPIRKAPGGKKNLSSVSSIVWASLVELEIISQIVKSLKAKQDLLSERRIEENIVNPNTGSEC